MIFYNLIWMLRGYLRVVCIGGFFEEFLDDLVQNGFDVFDIERGKNATRFSIRCSQYKLLRSYVKKHQCRIQIEKKKGYRFWFKRVKFFRFLLVGLTLFAVILTFIGNYVMIIEVKGDNPLTDREVIEMLGSYGLQTGAKISDINVPQLEGQLLLDFDAFSWAAINLSYGKALVEVKAKVEQPENMKGAEHTVIAAKYDGIIKSIDVISGTCLVNVGDVVAKDATLVVPAETNVINSWVTTVNATIVAQTSHSAVFYVERNATERIPTGKAVNDRFLVFQDNVVPLISLGCNYRYFDEIQYRESVEIFGVTLPFSIQTIEYHEVYQSYDVLNQIQSDAIFERQLESYIRSELSDCEVLDVKYEVMEDGGTFIYYVEFICHENIAVYITV